MSYGIVYFEKKTIHVSFRGYQQYLPRVQKLLVFTDFAGFFNAVAKQIVSIDPNAGVVNDAATSYIDLGDLVVDIWEILEPRISSGLIWSRSDITPVFYELKGRMVCLC